MIKSEVATLKFCSDCGHQLEDEAKFCVKCGTKIPGETINTKIDEYLTTPDYGNSYSSPPKKKRRGLKILAIICFIIAAFSVLMATVETIMLAMAPFMIIIGIMFLILSGTEKGSESFYLGKTRNSNPLKKKTFVIISLIAAFVVFVVFESTLSGINFPKPKDKEAFTSESIPTSTKPIDASKPTPTTPEPLKVILDVTKFANITSDELKRILGEPSSKESTTYEGTITAPCEYYYYNSIEGLSEVEFLLINDKVIQMLTYTELDYRGGKDILARVGIANPSSTFKAVDQSTAVRYRCPTGEIDDVWISLIDSEKDTFGFLRVTYDLFYSEEWYIPLSVEEQASYNVATESSVKSILKSPGSAKFPWLDWSYGKNPWYVAVQSYVDAQNSFGAEIRSDFTFIYDAVTGTLVYAIFDGEVVHNEAYVPLKDLVKQAASAD